jgi:hypothetical protein
MSTDMSTDTNLEQTPSWSAAEAAKAEWLEAFANTSLSDADKNKKKAAYTRLMTQCMREAGLVPAR